MTPPVHPCGRAVDWLRSGYDGFMRFWPDRPDQVVKVRWFRTDKPFLPFYHSFGSLNWSNVKGSVDQGVGESADHPRTWNNGSVPYLYPGLSVCGSPGAWVNGVPFPFPPPPILVDYSSPCCNEVALCAVDKWRIEAAGFTGACAAFNGTWHLFRKKGSACSWTNAPLLPQWQILDPAMEAGTLVALACADADCSGWFATYGGSPAPATVQWGVPIVLGHGTGSSNCPGFPLTIALTPVS
jgi:hypothetical protein